MFLKELEILRQNNLLRQIRDRERSSDPTGIFFENTRYINFSSNDYLGLSGNRSVIEAAKMAMDEFGFGAGASRLLSGGTVLYRRLEESIAEFKDTEDALLFNSGYIANISAIPSIAGEGDVIFSDELNHASIVDGCRLSRAKKVIFRHKDMDHLSELIEKENGKRKIVITDSVFSMDGDIAPLKDIHDICLKYCAILYIDDAHGTGVLGNGKGALAHFGLGPQPWIIQMGTLSKALGSYGAFIAAGKDIIEWLINTARGLIFSTALPSCIIAASLEALRILKDDPTPVKRLWQNRDRLYKGIRDMGFDTLNSETPIIPIVAGDVVKTLRLSKTLLMNRIYAPAIRPPTVKTPRIRVTVTASHREQEIEELLRVLKRFCAKITKGHK